MTISFKILYAIFALQLLVGGSISALIFHIGMNEDFHKLDYIKITFKAPVDTVLSMVS